MTRTQAALLILFGLAINPVEARELEIGDIVVNSFRGTVETNDYTVTLDYIPNWVIERDVRKFRSDLWQGWDYTSYTLRNKATSYQKTALIPADGGKEPRFRGIETEEYCGVKVLLVFVQRDTPRYGGALSRWLTTYVFRADTFALLAEYDGTPYDITRFDNRFVPEVDSIMDERYLVSCFPEGRGRPFDFGLIDRKKLYGPDWCGPQSQRCRIKAPTASGGG